MGNIVDWVDVDLDSYEEWGDDYVAPDPGDYWFRVSDCQPGEAKSSGKRKVVVTFEVVSNEDGSDTPMAGRKAFEHIGIEGESVGKLKKILAICGVENTGSGFSPAALKEQELCGTIVHEPYTDTKKIDPATGKGQQKMGSRVMNLRPLPAAPAAKAKGGKPGHNARQAQRQ